MKLYERKAFLTTLAESESDAEEMFEEVARATDASTSVHISLEDGGPEQVEDWDE